MNAALTTNNSGNFCLQGGGLQEVAERERPALRTHGSMQERLRGLRRERRDRTSSLKSGAGAQGAADDSIVVVGGGVSLASARR